MTGRRRLHYRARVSTSIDRTAFMAGLAEVTAGAWKVLSFGTITKDYL
jgi:hypothetical protein